MLIKTGDGARLASIAGRRQRDHANEPGSDATSASQAAMQATMANGRQLRSGRSVAGTEGALAQRGEQTGQRGALEGFLSLMPLRGTLGGTPRTPSDLRLFFFSAFLGFRRYVDESSALAGRGFGLRGAGRAAIDANCTLAPWAAACASLPLPTTGSHGRVVYVAWEARNRFRIPRAWAHAIGFGT